MTKVSIPRIVELATPILCANCGKWDTHGEPAESGCGLETHWYVRHAVGEKAQDCFCSKTCFDQFTGSISI